MVLTITAENVFDPGRSRYRKWTVTPEADLSLFDIKIMLLTTFL